MLGLKLRSEARMSEQTIRVSRSLDVSAAMPWLVAIAVYLLLMVLGNRLLGDADTYWHITLGRLILEHRALPTGAALSQTVHATNWVAYEWLSQIAYAAAYALGGWVAVAALTAAAAAAAFGLLTRYLLKYWQPTPTIAAVLAALVLTSPHIMARPHVLALPLMVAWIALLIRAVDTARPPSWWLLPVMTLWANLHGSFIFGLAMTGVVAAEAIWNAAAQDRRSVARQWIVFGVLALGAACANPYGPELIRATIRILSLGQALSLIVEWRPQDFSRLGAYNKLFSNFDRIPQGASQPLIKARSIDDVPVLAMTLWGKNYEGAALRRIAAEAQQSVKQVANVSETTLLGGEKRELKVTLDTQKLAAYRLSPLVIARALQTSNRRLQAGSFAEGNQEFAVDAGSFLQSAEETRKILVAVQGGRPVYLGDVATVTDGPEEPTEYVYFGTGGAGFASGGTYPAVTLTVAKRKGANATNVSQDVLAKMDSLRGYVIPNDVEVTVTRNYGQTAKHKSDELLKHLFLATISVTILVGLALGWRESGVVLLAIPVTLALTLFIFYAYGYTLNRVTLFALIFSIGILVDDAIVVVENIVRHFRLPESQGRSWSDVAVEAVDEVGNPTILATFAVIAAILPMAFVRGLMGPYMRPIPVGASAAMLFSLMVAFVVSPWAALRLLRGHTGKHSRR